MRSPPPPLFAENLTLFCFRLFFFYSRGAPFESFIVPFFTPWDPPRTKENPKKTQGPSFTAARLFSSPRFSPPSSSTRLSFKSFFANQLVLLFSSLSLSPSHDVTLSVSNVFPVPAISDKKPPTPFRDSRGTFQLP